MNTTTYYAHMLARIVGVSTDLTTGSPGSQFLLDIADTYKVERESIRDSDYPVGYLSELADSAVPASTHAQWEIFTDLQLYQVESDLLGETTAQEFLDKGPATLLYEVASNLLNALGWEHDREAMEK